MSSVRIARSMLAAGAVQSVGSGRSAGGIRTFRSLACIGTLQLCKSPLRIYTSDSASLLRFPPHCPTRHKSSKAPGRSLAPEPNPPARMVEEGPRPPRGLKGLLRKLFNGSKSELSFTDKQLKPLDIPEQNNLKFLRAEAATNLLYWYCTDLTFAESDFQRIGPPNSKFVVTRARNPVNLTRWMGYFLQFTTVEDAVAYFEHTLGHELCGFPLKLRFTSPGIQGFQSPLLAKSTVPRRAHVLLLGLPVGFPEHTILRVLWDYDLIDDDILAVERMPMGNISYGGSPVLLRFKTEKEAERFVREYNREPFPYSESKILCEVID